MNARPEAGRPAHHLANGRFTNPWPNSAHGGTPLAVLKWQWQRLRHGRAAAPAAGEFETATPAIRYPHAALNECRITWLGQSAFMVQVGGMSLLTDPVLSLRASPFARIGPSRLVAAPLAIDDLPEIGAVVISHDHYDHLDARTIAGLIERFGVELQFIAPLGFSRWFRKLGALNVSECDWWQSATCGNVEFTALPAQHWSRRGFDTGERLWCSWMIRAKSHSIYFTGDSGYCPAFKEIAERVGAPDIALIPIGAYEPRWFMKAAHMNPEEAVQTYLDLGASEFVGMHWGTFHLTDEPMLEPPERVLAAWQAHRLSPERLHIPCHGETLVFKSA